MLPSQGGGETRDAAIFIIYVLELVLIGQKIADEYNERPRVETGSSGSSRGQSGGFNP